MISLLYHTFIFTALIIFAVLFHLKYITTNFLKVITEIIKMNELNEYDPVKFVENLPPLMDRLGIKSYSYYFFYLDTEYQKTAVHSRNSIKKFVCAPDFTVYVEVSPGKLKWERSYLGILLVETIFLLLKVDVTLYLRSASKALAEFSRINSFLSHDIKNLAQFINIMEHNIGTAVTPEQKDKLLGYMKESAPALKMRADRVLLSLADASKGQVPEKETIVPCDLATNIASIMNLPLECSGSTEGYCLDRKSIIIIFENIIKNFYDKSITEPGIKLKMETVKGKDGLYISFTDNGSAIPNTEKIFEPFHSGKKGGLGIGLYHCRNMANNMNGKIWAENTAEGPRFTLSIKCDE